MKAIQAMETEALYGIISEKAANAVSFEEFISKLSPKKKELIQAAIELYKRSINKEGTQVFQAEDVFNYMQGRMQDLDHEELHVLYLRNNHSIIKVEQINIGCIASCSFDDMRALKNALLLNAPCMIIVHNHPSGSPTPSPSDDKLTSSLKEKCDLLGIRLLDHVIIANTYFSYAEAGKLI